MNELTLFFLAMAMIAASVLFWSRYDEAMDKCTKAGKTPAWCYEYLK